MKTLFTYFYLWQSKSQFLKATFKVSLIKKYTPTKQGVVGKRTLICSCRHVLLLGICFTCKLSSIQVASCHHLNGAIVLARLVSYAQDIAVPTPVRGFNRPQNGNCSVEKPPKSWEWFVIAKSWCGEGQRVAGCYLCFRCIHIVTILGFLFLFWFQTIQLWQQKLPHEIVGAFNFKKNKA